MGETLERDKWVSRVLGVEVNRPTPSSLGPNGRPRLKAVGLAPPKKGAPMMGRGRSNALVPPPRTLPPEIFKGPSGKPGDRLIVTKKEGGGIVYTAPPKPVREITFSGGGGKGVALPGAVKALEESGVLDDAKVITGASVGSMTAALVACGITAEEFTRVGNAKESTDRITEGSGGTKLGLAWAALKNKATTGSGNPLTGQGLEDVVRDVLDETLRLRMSEYIEQCSNDAKPPSPAVVKVMKKLAGNKSGPTFGDLRELSKVIPKIKEVVITGTYTTEFEDVTDKKGKTKKKEVKDGNDTGQLYIFSADTEPDLEVAIAVHASASFPIAFKPVDIKLASGMTVRFIDGGVMNNTPTSSSIGNDRKLDPEPEGRGMTFVFEDGGGKAERMLDGKVNPPSGKKPRFQDWLIGSEHAGAEYGKNRDTAMRPEEMVIVPLTFKMKPDKKGKEKVYDMRGGTLNFNVPDEVKEGLQKKTEEATNTQISRENQPKTREYASDSQMFVSISLPELKQLADGKYEGAEAALEFRNRVKVLIGELASELTKENTKKGGKVSSLPTNPDVTKLLGELDQIAGNDSEFQSYVGREMNRGSIDTLLDAIRKSKVRSKVVEAGLEVSDALAAQSRASNILKNFVLPQMKYQNKDGSGMETLLNMETKLRRAQSQKEINTVLTLGIDHFKNKSDKSIPGRGHKKFAASLQHLMM